MNEPAPDVTVHALVICRQAEVSPSGNIDVKDVLEIVPVEALPGEAGPLTFLALVRNLPSGQGEGCFVISAQATPPRVVARCPIEVQVPSGYAGRQMAVQVRLPSLPVARGGWYEVAFEWRGARLATNRFAVGARRSAATQPAAPVADVPPATG